MVHLLFWKVLLQKVICKLWMTTRNTTAEQLSIVSLHIDKVSHHQWFWDAFCNNLVSLFTFKMNFFINFFFLVFHILFWLPNHTGLHPRTRFCTCFSSVHSFYDKKLQFSSINPSIYSFLFASFHSEGHSFIFDTLINKIENK